MPRYRLLTFDVYTALFDVEGSLVPMVRRALPAEVDAHELVRAWRRKQLEYVLLSNSLQQGRVSFRDITRRALEYSLSRIRTTLSEPVLEEFVSAWDDLQLWPEAEGALKEIEARGYRMGLLSNGDEAMLRALAARLPVRCDDVFASDQAGHYKPHPSVYALPLHALNITADQMLHVVGSATDVMGTKAAGLRCAWVNRGRDRVVDPRLAADDEFEDLHGILTLL